MNPNTAIIRFGNKLFVCELKTVRVKSGKTTEKVFCKELKREDNKF